MKQVIWDKEAQQSFSQELFRLKKRSASLAAQAGADILAGIDHLAADPYRHQPDRFKRNNDGSFRIFELHRLRISYFVGSNEVLILRVLHWRRKAR